jgi:lipoprotein-anchoring transpeptidase ErfK/SrfK
VRSGAYDKPTPKGTFEIHRKQKLRVSNLDVPYRMPYYMAFTESESHGFHALPFLGKNPESSDFWQEARSHIGIPVSHGCVRLLPEDAAKVYEWVEVGTKVYISA